MATKIEKDLEQAILAMPQKDKDKLLLRLVRKDAALVEQLRFQLMEDEVDMESRLLEVKQYADQFFRSSRYADTPGWVMMDMRSVSGEINRYVKTTKDKRGEIELQLYLLNKTFEACHEVLHKKQHRADKFSEYVVKRAQQVLNKLKRLHEDYHFEFEDDVQLMLKNIWAYPPTRTIAEEVGLPKEWG